ELIFPGAEYRRNGMEGVYQAYPQQIEEFRRHDAHHWGTYAERMLRVTLADGTILHGKDGLPLNPLRTLIHKMKRANNGGQAAHACYELSINRPWRDDNVIRGSPCLSHLSFKLYNHAVHLTAIYRNHDYTFKVPGNLLGLARLQAAVAREIGGSVGPLVIHSTQAYLDNKAGTRKLVKPA
ncbi:MAG: hypothetical protein LC623_09200, partial [Halobacteriales archaeon]|nr:hypothetical protein [Halobacteriales archaeon]